MERLEKCSAGPGDRTPILDSVGGHGKVGSSGARGKSREDRSELAPSNLAGNCALDRAFRLGWRLRGDCFPWLFAEAISGSHRKYRRGSGSASTRFWRGSCLPGDEAGRRDQRAGYALRSVGSMAQESAPWNDRAHLFGHRRWLARKVNSARVAWAAFDASVRGSLVKHRDFTQNPSGRGMAVNECNRLISKVVLYPEGHQL